MAETRKILGQVALAATTLTALYTVPASTQAVVSSIVVCNRGASATTFRVSLSVAGAADATNQYLYYDVALPANDTFVATIGVALGAADVVRGYAGNANVSMTVLGVELT